MKHIIALVALCGLIGRISGQAENPCASTPENGVVSFGDPFDCTRFTTCIGRTAHQRVCPEGMHFSNSEGQCDLIERAQCTPQVNPNPPKPEPICSININLEVIASHTNCNAFTVCACGHAHPTTCATGLIFDSRSQQCNVAASARCLTDPRNVPTCTTVGNVGHPHDCKHFYLCLGAGSTAQLRRCAPGLRFNRNLNQCDQISCQLPGATRRSFFEALSYSCEVNSSEAKY